MDNVVECPGCQARDLVIAELRTLITALQSQVALLQAEVASLTRKLDERPSPPRAQGGMPPAPAKKATGKKRGAQPGHPPHLKQLVPAERVDRFVSLAPEVCTGCHAD